MMMVYSRDTSFIFAVVLPLFIVCKVSTGITVNFVNEQQGAMTATVDEDFGFVSLLVTTTEDASFTVSPEPFSSASLGVDFTIMEENYVLSTNENLTLSVNIIDDSVVEEREFIGITFVSNVTNDIRLFIFIRDNDRLSVAFFRNNYTTSESKPANVCIEIIEGSIERSQPIELTLVTSPGSASPLEDYVPARIVLSITRDISSSILCANIATLPDSVNAPIVEDTEHYLVIYELNSEIEMLNPSNMTVYITDEDGAFVSIFNPLNVSQADFQINESDSNTTIRVYVQLNPPENVSLTLQRSVNVFLSTSFGTADDSDFVGVSNEVITITSDATVASYDITILGDIIPEPDERFTFKITAVNLADQVLSPSQGTITILNDDQVPDCGIPPDPGANGQVNFTTTTYLAEANYSCNIGYELIGADTTRTCLLNGTWSGEDLICEIVDCGNLTSPLQGYVSIAETTFGSAANYTCFEGYELLGNGTRTCTEIGVWSGSEPTCNLVDCGDLSPPSFGNVTFNATTYQSSAVYDCLYGYNLIGNSSRYCQANGQWSGMMPTCELVDCGSLMAPPFGDVNVTDTTFGSVANYSCQGGYIINGTSLRVCESNGQWSESSPQCTPVDCGDLSAPSNGGVNIDGGTLYPTGKAVYQCNVGYELVGAVLDTRSCLSTGLWSGVEPMCTLIRCGTLPHPRNGRVSTNNPPVNGTLANYTCDAGFQLMGSAVRRCEERLWSGKAPQCKPVDCGNLTNPQNGTVTLSSTVFGSIADYMCGVSFVINGTMRRTCQSDGIWSGTKPSCQVVDCGDLRDPVDGSVTFIASTRFGSLAEYSCHNDFLLLGNVRRTCQANGQWSGSDPSCLLDGALNRRNSNSEFVVTVVSASVGGFILAIIVIVIVMLAAVARVWRKRRESYSFTHTVTVTRRPHNQRQIQLVSPMHPGVYIPRRGLDHPLYDSVFANTGSTPELPDERPAETIVTRDLVVHPAIMIEASDSEEDVVHIPEQATASNDDSSAHVHDSRSARLNVSSTATYKSSVASAYQDLEHILSSDLPPTSDKSSFVFYDRRPTD